MRRSEMPERQSTREQYAPSDRRRMLAESRTALIALGVFLLVFLVALGSGRSLARVTGPGDLANTRTFAGDLIVLVVAVAVVPAVLFAGWQVLRDLRGEGAPNGERRRERRVIKQFLIIALLGGAIALAVLLGGRQRNPGTTDQPSNRHRSAAVAPRSSSRSQKTAEELLPWVAGGVGACLVLLLSGALIQRRRRLLAALALPEDGLESPRRELHELFGISIAEIERESDPRRAVIRAYAAMETTLVRHKLGRRPFEAPGEYLSRVFSTLRLSRRPAERLTELFERARFSEHAIGSEMKRESIAALGELRSELEAKQR